MSRWPNSDPETRRRAGLPPLQPNLLEDEQLRQGELSLSLILNPRQYKPRVASLLRGLREQLANKLKGQQQ